MKKMIKFTLPILAIAMLLSTTLVQAEYSVTVGATYTFNVVEASQTISMGSNSGGGDGILFEDHAFPEGQQIVVEVTAESSSTVDYDITVGSIVDSQSSSGFGDIFFVAFTLILPMLYTLGFGVWNQTAVDAGPGLWGTFFIDTIMSEAFAEFSNQTAIDESFTNTGDIQYKKVGGHFDNSTSIAVFDWAYDIQITNSTTNTDFGGTYRWKFAYEKNTGVVKGWKIALDYSGTLEGTVLDIVMSQTVTQVGYNIGNFYFGVGGFIPGFEWFIAVPALALLGGVAIIVKKRK
ncbi:MAG: hypothetical protein JXA54_13065 [Candidatus Heimdallarchaeota archaeon]|nr:hypothetical protein [Candidatus Heimdallarchaeota archaeon]